MAGLPALPASAPIKPEVPVGGRVKPDHSQTRTTHLSSGPGARSSVGERSLHTREVAGSKPAAPIPQKACYRFAFVRFAAWSKRAKTALNIGFLPNSAQCHGAKSSKPR